MTPQRAQELEAELRRLGFETERAAMATRIPIHRQAALQVARAYEHAADLVRAKAKGE